MLTEDELRSLEQWAAVDLRDDDGDPVQDLIDEVRESRAQLAAMRSVVLAACEWRRDYAYDTVMIGETDRLMAAVDALLETGWKP